MNALEAEASTSKGRGQSGDYPEPLGRPLRNPYLKGGGKKRPLQMPVKATYPKTARAIPVHLRNQ